MIGNSGNLIRPNLILFDVYETLLNMSEVERRVNNLMDNKKGFNIWFELFMQYCFVDNCIAQFNSFPTIAKATMQMAGRIVGRSIIDHEINEILELLKHLPLHEGVQEGLSMLHDKEFRIAALTNSPSQIVLDRMERTGLISYFEMVLSAEQVKKYKPSLEVYQWAAKTLEVPIHEVLLVSSHGWDIIGGANAGMRTAYIKQKNQILYPLAPKPFIISDSLLDLAGKLNYM